MLPTQILLFRAFCLVAKRLKHPQKSNPKMLSITYLQLRRDYCSRTKSYSQKERVRRFQYESTNLVKETTKLERSSSSALTGSIPIVAEEPSVNAEEPSIFAEEPSIFAEEPSVNAE